MREKKTIPFQKGMFIEFFKGSLVSAEDETLFEYSISTKKHLGNYRLTLSFDQGEIKKVCVFTIDPDENPVSIVAENETGQFYWKSTSSQKPSMEKAIDLIIQHHLQFT